MGRQEPIVALQPFMTDTRKITPLPLGASGRGEVRRLVQARWDFLLEIDLSRRRLPEYDIVRSGFVGIEMKASTLSFRAAVLMVIAGMIWGIVMGISQDHSTMPAHAHLNLLGWVSLFLFGIYYHLHPAVDLSRLASLQVWIWIVGTIILTIGVGLVHSGHAVGDPIAAVSSLVVLADTLLWFVFRPEPAELASPRSTVPAE